MIRLIFIILAFLMMVGALVGGLYFWGVDPLEKFDQLVGNAPGPASAVKAQPASFVEFGLLIVPVVQEREVKKQVEMILRLEVYHDKKEGVAHNLPRLQNAYLQEMMSFLPIHLRDNDRPDLPTTRRRLTVVSERVLGPGMVKDVLIEQTSVK